MEISALIVTLNEEARLKECLESLLFCDQRVVVDLGSTDRSPEIGRKYATEFFTHPPVPAVEEIWVKFFPTLKYNWILRADPDEVFPVGLLPKIEKLFLSPSAIVGAYTVPYQYFFKGKPLNYTVWGGIRDFTKLFHKERIDLYSRVHAGIRIKDGFIQAPIPYDGINKVNHFWVDSFTQLFLKHERYLRTEGKSRFEQNHRYTWSQMIRATRMAFKESFFKTKGYRQGFLGIFLSLFYAYYECRAWLSLKKFMRTSSAIQM